MPPGKTARLFSKGFIFLRKITNQAIENIHSCRLNCAFLVFCELDCRIAALKPQSVTCWEPNCTSNGPASEASPVDARDLRCLCKTIPMQNIFFPETGPWSQKAAVEHSCRCFVTSVCTDATWTSNEIYCRKTTQFREYQEPNREQTDMKSRMLTEQMLRCCKDCMGL